MLEILKIKEKIGVLLVNLGTPSAPTTKAVRRYLREFLSDGRVVNLAKILWLPILNLVVLPMHSKKSAHAYKSVWTEEGSPLLAISKKQQVALADYLTVHSEFKKYSDTPIKIALAMCYGKPSIAEALEELRAQKIKKLIILPLYPQYSATTTAAIFDKVADVFRSWRVLPDFRFISNYYAHAQYIETLAHHIESFWRENPRAQKILFSFHGLPKTHIKAGDPYFDECKLSTKNLVRRLNLPEDGWQLSFQSRLGKAEWLKPYTDKTLKTLAKEGVASVQVVCPGFSADCLETLEEVAIEYKKVFLKAGGKRYEYIPCLNDTPSHIAFFAELIKKNLGGF